MLKFSTQKPLTKVLVKHIMVLQSTKRGEQMEYCDVEMVSKVLPGEDLTKMVKKIVNDFAAEGMSRDEAMEVLKKVEEIMGEVAIIQRME